MSTATHDLRQLPDAGSDNTTDEDPIDLRDYIKIVRKHRWAILLTSALLTAIAAYVVSGMTPIYRATTTLLIETQQTMPMNIDEIIGIDTTNREYYETQFEVLRSRKLAKRVMDEMGLYSHPEFYNPNDAMLEQSPGISTPTLVSDANTDSAANSYGAQSLDNDSIQRQVAVNRFLSRLSVLPVKNTKLVRIRFESSDPYFAAQVANKVADTYIISYLDSRMEMGEKATGWLGERLTGLKLKLEESQNKLLTYKEQNGLIEVEGSVGRLSEQEIGIITSKLLDLSLIHI